MASFGRNSQRHLATCHQAIQDVLTHAIRFTDFSVIEGHRSLESQKAYIEAGLSKIKDPTKGKHTIWPSMAVHCLPYPASAKVWEQSARFAYMAAHILRSAEELGIEMRWGGNWDRDDIIIYDQDFDDLAHFELV